MKIAFPNQTKELPDLRPNAQASVPFIEWKLFPECDCAVDEGCAGVGKRKLLRFTMETWNVGYVVRSVQDSRLLT